MKDENLPANYQRIMPYLVIRNAAAFIQFVKDVFNATEQYKAMRSETLIAHGEVNIGGSTIMFADATEQFNEQTSGLFIYVESCDETYQKAIAHGATTITEPGEQSYGRSAGVKDPFGNTWWITA